MKISLNGHAGNGLAPSSRSWQHLAIDRRGAGYCHVTFDHPPINAVTEATVDELAELVGLIEHDVDLTVVVFASAHPDSYLTGDGPPDDPGRAGGTADDQWGRTWSNLLLRLSRVPVVSIAAIRGRVGGAGCEFALACDLRFASRENSTFGPLGVARGGAVAGGSMTRLSRLVGRGRALEVLLSTDWLDGPLAERYGCVNRVIADARLDGVMRSLAERLERFDREVIACIKAGVDLEAPSGE